MCIYQSFTRHQAYTVEISRERISHWGRVTHICVSKLTIIGWDNGLSPGRRQAIIWTNDGILLIWSFGTIFSDILIEIHLFSFKKIHLNMSSAKCRPFCLGLNVIYHKHTHSLVLCGCDISSGFRWSIWPHSSWFLHRCLGNIVFRRNQITAIKGKQHEKWFRITSLSRSLHLEPIRIMCQTKLMAGTCLYMRFLWKE